MARMNDIAAVVDRHFEAVYAYVAYRVTPDLDAAADITQEVFMAAGRSLARFRGEASPLTWLRSLARRKVADHYRSQDRQQRVIRTYQAALIDASPPRPEDNGAEIASRVSRTMQQLTDDHVELLELKYLEARSVREIAAERAQTEKAVESALSRARAAFRDAYQGILAAEED